MRVSVMQMNPGANKSENIAQARHLIEQAVEQDRPNIVSLPEVWDSLGGDRATRTMHLFDITAPDGTGYRESNSYGAGDEVVTYEADGVTVGCAICYDVRFPDLFWKLREQGAELIFLPSAFTLATGKDHWEALIKGRAIETQCWFAAPATWGKHLEGKGDPRFTYGHSMVVNPWGHLVAQVSDGVGWTTARIDQDLTTRVRRDMPVLEHRKRV